MSGNQLNGQNSSSYSYSSASYSSMSYSSSSTSGSDGRTTRDFQAQSQQSYSDGSGNTWSSSTNSDRSGTVVRDAHRSADGETRSQTTRYDSGGRQLGGGDTRGQIEDVTDREAADRLYEERIEDEYAKREGGA